MEEMKQMAYKAMAKPIEGAFERNLLPDFMVRSFIRLELKNRLQSFYQQSSERQLAYLVDFVDALKKMPMKLEYGIPEIDDIPLFKLFTGKRIKLSCGYFADARTSLDDADVAMLEMYCERSGLKDGHTVLDIGCGLGSLVLHIAQKYTKCKVTGLCYSEAQKDYIQERCRDLQLKNVEIIVADVTTLEMEGSYDRIFSIQVFEHLKNYRDLLKKISNWMKPDDGVLFIEVFCHKTFPYHSEDVTDDEWLTKYFLRKGTMLSGNLFLYFQDDVSIVNHWLINGKHLARTCDEFIKRMDKNKAYIKQLLETTRHNLSVDRQILQIKTTFTVMSEAFGYNNGEEWMVAQFLFKKK